MSVRKRRKAVKPIAVGYIKETDQPWRVYFLSVYNSYKQNFSSREFGGIFELKKVCITQNKKNFSSVF